ncbi:Predicted membrane protein (DUF2306) [Streptomyces sp. MnatMP-M77]|uniref:DUF2306 domain-containing protein n=1 Tax=Streptomyces TaxID=1883 RepID=UPI000804BF47|nr:DUF2306 domain-containing protein [Streptomyces sp. MnatMP-M77]MYT78984.1 DUF2306 domain-containing protein [Streptomyces sp. SID8364]SBU94138.1 Predicted membrane protein (DUF2306) [Streptomyces sp. MnatMP-M77]
MAQQTEPADVTLPSPDRKDGPAPEQGPSRPGRAWWRRPWPLLLALLVTLFLVDELTAYLGLEPSEARITLNEDVPLHYPLLVAHIGFGTIALVTVVLQVWPLLRRNHPRIHRASGRLYVFAGALPSAVLALAIMPLMPAWQGTIGVAVHALLWIGTTTMGYRAARKRQYDDHRRWMLYSFALATGVLWGRAMVNVMTYAELNIDVGYLFEVARWLGWMINLMLVQWWLDRRPNRPAPAPV